MILLLNYIHDDKELVFYNILNDLRFTRFNRAINNDHAVWKKETILHHKLVSHFHHFFLFSLYE